jgi:phosphoglycerate dehydrogenase-like enzyme
MFTSNGSPVAVFNYSHPWMRDIVLRVAPPEFDVRFLTDPRDTHQVQELLGMADFFVTVDLPAAWVAELHRCRLVQLQGVGYDAVDLSALAVRGIPLAQTPEGTIVGVAEHTLMFILALYKRLAEVHDHVRQGGFDKIGFRAGCHMLCGKTLGIVGFGRIGRRVAHLARAFETATIYADPVAAGLEAELEVGARRVSFEELLALSDVVSVHVPLTAETEGLFGADEFAQMKPGALFINTGRGGTYDLDALYEALASGRLGGAGLDVFPLQPPPANHPLLKLPNVLCTPHMAAGTVEAHLEKAQAQFDNFRRVLRGDPPIHLIPLPQMTSATAASALV